MRRVRVGLAQVNPTVGAIEANARLVIDWMDRARAAGLRHRGVPGAGADRLSPGGPRCSSPPSSRPISGRSADVARASRGLTAVVGFVDKRDDIFNAAAVLHDGAQAGTYHKQYLPNYGVFDENRYFQSGTEAPVFTLGETVHRGEHLRGHLVPDRAHHACRRWRGAELVLSINASPYHAGKAQLPREDAGHARRRRPRVPGLRQHGGRAGRADLRRPVLHLQREGRVRGARAGLRGRPRGRRPRPRRGLPRPPPRLAAAQGEAARPPRPSRAAWCCPRGPRRSGRSCPSHEVPVLEPVEEIYRALVLGTRRLRDARTGSATWRWGSRAASTPRWWLPSPATRSAPPTSPA